MIHCRPDLNMSDWIHVSHRTTEDLWLPEVSITNMVEVRRMQLMEEVGFMRVRGDQTINTVYNLRLSFVCPMDLAMYPHDIQVDISNFILFFKPISSVMVTGFNKVT